MLDNYNEYDDDYENDEEDYNFHNDYERPRNTLFFAKGAYTITLISVLDIGASERLYTYRVSQTQYITKSSPSLIDIYELFENSFLLEFMISIISNGTLNIRSCKKLMSLTDKDACIMVTASFSIDQNFLLIEDEVESDTSVTEMISIGKTQVMRSYQLFYCVTQPAKYTSVKYDVVTEGLDWMNHQIDWQQMYFNFIDPYIRMMMAMQLKVPIDHDKDFKEQFLIDRGSRSFYAEIYILPNSVFGRDLVYSNGDGRQIMICNEVNGRFGMDSDTYRVCMGTQNLTLLPIDNLMIYHTIENGKQFIMGHETSGDDWELQNKFLLSSRRWSKLGCKNVMWLTQLKEFPQCQFSLYVLDNIEEFDNLKTLEEQNKFIREHEHEVKSICQFFGFSESYNDQLCSIRVSSDAKLIGTMCFSLADYIKPDALVYTIDDDPFKDPDDSFLPVKFYENLTVKYKLPKDTKFTLIPIRALPKYREFMVIAVNEHFENKETQSDIIQQSKENLIEKPKKGFFQSLFGK